VHTKLPDGLYQVTTGYLCAGLIIRHNRVIEAAPVLCERLAYWLTLARRVDADPRSTGPGCVVHGSATIAGTR
jgi:hypothetical protein